MATPPECMFINGEASKLASGVALQFLLGKEGAKDLDTASVIKTKIKDPNTKRALSNLITGILGLVNHIHSRLRVWGLKAQHY